MKFVIHLRDGIYSWTLLDANNELIAVNPWVGVYPKSACLAQIQKVKGCMSATIEDKTPAKPPPAPPYEPRPWERD